MARKYLPLILLGAVLGFFGSYWWATYHSTRRNKKRVWEPKKSGAGSLPLVPALVDRSREKRERRRIMKACGDHDKCIVVFEGGNCPLCGAEKTLKNVWEEMEKSMAILKEVKQAGEEAGLKIK